MGDGGTDRHSNTFKHTNTHINIMTGPGLRAGPIESHNPGGVYWVKMDLKLQITNMVSLKFPPTIG